MSSAREDLKTNVSHTVPLQCPICLDQVKTPMICPNQHIFCKQCIVSWLESHPVCPTCRVPLTEATCLPIRGGDATPESLKDDQQTRIELLHARSKVLAKGYKKETKALCREVDQLRKQVSLLQNGLVTRVSLMEDAVTSLLPPVSTSSSSSAEAAPTPVSNQSESTASPRQQQQQPCAQCKEIIARYSKTCSTLQATVSEMRKSEQKTDCERTIMSQEIRRLRQELVTSSPKKPNRYAAAAEESRTASLEREVSQLKRALERSDRCIDDLRQQLATSASSSSSPSSMARHMPPRVATVTNSSGSAVATKAIPTPATPPATPRKRRAETQSHESRGLSVGMAAGALARSSCAALPWKPLKLDFSGKDETVDYSPVLSVRTLCDGSSLGSPCLNPAVANSPASSAALMMPPALPPAAGSNLTNECTDNIALWPGTAGLSTQAALGTAGLSTQAALGTAAQSTTLSLAAAMDIAPRPATAGVATITGFAPRPATAVNTTAGLSTAVNTTARPTTLTLAAARPATAGLSTAHNVAAHQAMAGLSTAMSIATRPATAGLSTAMGIATRPATAGLSTAMSVSAQSAAPHLVAASRTRLDARRAPIHNSAAMVTPSFTVGRQEGASYPTNHPVSMLEGASYPTNHPVSMLEGASYPPNHPASMLEGVGCPPNHPASMLVGVGCPPNHPASMLVGASCPPNHPASMLEGASCPPNHHVSTVDDWAGPWYFSQQQ